MAQDKKCTKCGREQSRSFATKHGWFGVTFHLYACQAPGCSEHNKQICEHCLKKLGVDENFWEGIKNGLP